MDNNDLTLFCTAGSGNSYKPALVAHQTGKQCNMQYLNLVEGENRSDEYLAINPLGKVPYLRKSNGQGIPESNAIAWYLAENTDLMPATAWTRSQAIQWMLFEQTALGPNISHLRLYTFVLPKLRARFEESIPKWLKAGNKALTHLEKHLTDREFITDHGYSVADICVFGYTHMADQAGFNLQELPAISAWIKRVQGTKNFASVEQVFKL